MRSSKPTCAACIAPKVRPACFTNTDAHDYATLIEWIAQQDWCTSAVGLCGVSYLAMSQWRVAALKPPHLKAIAPWEGVTDLLREFAFQDGIPETGFIPKWWKFRMQRGHNKRFPMAENFLSRMPHSIPPTAPTGRPSGLPSNDIDVPALVCCNWSDQGLHTRGSLEGYLADRIRPQMALHARPAEMGDLL